MPDGSPSASPTARSITEVSPRLRDEVAGQAQQPQRHQRGALGELEQVGAHQRAAVDVPERGRHLLVDHPHHLLGGDAVGRQAGHEGAGARAHVDVELVDRAVDGQQVERPQRADLVDPAGEAAAAEHQRGLGPAPPARGLPGCRLPALGRLLELDYFAHPQPIIPYRVDARDAPRSLHPAGSAVVSPAAGGRRAPGPRPRSEARAESALRATLAGHMAAAGRFSGAYVVNTTDGRVVFQRRARQARILASNTKLFTTATALARFGTEGTLGTEVLGRGRAGRGRRLARRPLSARRRRPDVRQPVASPAAPTAAAPAPSRSWRGCSRPPGIERVTGRIVGDESRFDTRRGTAYSGFSTSVDIGGPLSALSYNRGLASEGGFSFQVQPGGVRGGQAQPRRSRSAAWRSAERPPRAATPAGAEVLASVDSPPMARLAALTNKPSDNYFAEMLLKAIGWQASGKGTTAERRRRRARLRAPARRAGANRRRLGPLAGRPRHAPAGGQAADRRCRPRAEFDAFFASLAVAGRDGTLSDRMRRGPAHSRCRGKTGTLSNVSALSGYCTRPLGRRLRLLDPDERRVSHRRPRSSRTGWLRRSPACAVASALAASELEAGPLRRGSRCRAPRPSSYFEPGSAPATT